MPNAVALKATARVLTLYGRRQRLMTRCRHSDCLKRVALRPLSGCKRLRSFALSAQNDLTGFTHQARLWVTWARLYQGKDETDRSPVEATVAKLRRSDYWMDQTLWHSTLAEILAAHGDVPGALQEAEEAVAYADESGSTFWIAHLLTLKGDLLQRLNVPVVEIETCYHQALDLARQQEAKSLELRAALALARLWHRQGRSQDARRLLSGVYAWFSEGFDTPDLVAAKHLLDRL